MKTILVIEDNFEMLENTSEILEIAGYNVHKATNGKEGVKLANELKPDLILCDIMMPELDGYGVLLILSKNIETAKIPFIFLTAKAEKSDFRKGMNLGADDYLTKPYEDTELIQAIEKRIDKYQKIVDVNKNENGIEKIISNLNNLSELKKYTLQKKSKIYKKKEFIYSEDSNINYVFYLSSGKVKITKTNEQGKELIIDLILENQFFGYSSIFDQELYNENAIAIENSEILYYDKNEFKELIYSNKDATYKILEILSGELKDKEEKLLKLAYNSVRKRVADALIDYWDRYYNDSEFKEFAISREDLSNIAGTASETVTRVLSDFQLEKLIDIESSKVKIKDYDKLKNLRN